MKKVHHSQVIPDAAYVDTGRRLLKHLSMTIQHSCMEVQSDRRERQLEHVIESF